MTGIRMTGVAVTLLVAVTLAAGGVATEPVDGHGPEQTAVQHYSSNALSMPGNDIPGITLNESEVGLELRPASQTVEPGENGTYDVVITGPDNGVSSYSFNVSVTDASVAEIDSFELDRTGLIDGSFITSDNSTVVFEVSLGNDDYVSSEEITVAAVDAAAVGSAGQSTDLAFTYDPNEAVLNNNTKFYTVVTDQSATLAVDGPPTFQVSNLTPAEASAVDGETLNISADVENVGGSGTQAVELSIDGYSESKNLTLASGATQTVTFTNVDTGAVGPGEYTHTIASENDSASGNLTVLAQAEFTVEILEANTPVEGEQLNVTAEITNAGDLEDTQTIDLNVGALGNDSTTVTLGGGNATNLTLSVGTESGDAGSYTAAVSSNDNSDNTSVTVTEPASFDVAITSVESAVTEGETVTVGYEVTNTGDAQATQDITFAVNGTTEDTESGVTLNGSETFSGQFTYDTAAGDAPAVSVTVSSDDDSASETVTVTEPASFDVTLTSVDSAVTEGETVTVGYEVTNTGDVQATQDIGFAVNGTTESTEPSLTLNGSETFNGQFTYNTVAGDAPAVSVTVSSDEDSASDTVAVNQPPNFVVAIVETTTPVEGERLNVTAQVENTGDIEDTQTINLSVGALGTDSTTVTLGGGGSTNVTLGVSTGAGDAGSYTATVSSADNSATANVMVLAPAEFTVDIVETTTPVEGERLNVTATIENTGDTEDTQAVALDAGALGTSSISLSLDAGSSTTETFSVGTGSGDAGSYTAEVSSDDDSDSTTVTVVEPATFTVAITGTNSPVVAGETLTVDVEIENTGDVADTQTVALDAGTLGTNSTSVSLDGGNLTTETLSVATESGDQGSYTVAASTDNDTDSTSVTVETGAVDRVEISPSGDRTITAGNSIDFSATAFDSQDNIVEEDDSQFNWSGEGGSISGSGLFDETATGTYNVTAALDGVAADPTAVTVETGPVDRIEIVPETDQTVTPSESIDFSATAYDAFDNVVTDEDSQFTWDAENGTISGSGRFNESDPGTYNVTATLDGVSSSETSVTVLSDSGEVGLELQPTEETIEPGETATYDVVITGADSGVSAYNFNVSVGDTGVAEVDEFNLDRTGFFDESFITSDNSTVVFDVSLGNDDYGSSEEIAVATVDLVAVGSLDDSTDIGFSYTEEAILNNNTQFYTVATDQSATLALDAPAEFQVSNLTPSEASAVAGETLNISADIENLGGSGTQTIGLSVDGYSESTQVSLSAGASQTVTFADIDTGDIGPGEYTHTIASENDSASGNLTVLAPAAFSVNITSTVDPVAGENLAVTAAIENTGDVEDTQTIALDLGILGSDSTAVTLGGGNSTEATLTVGTSGGDAGEYTATVTSEDDQDTANVTVLSPASFAVDIVSAGDPVEDENLTVTAAIENTGDVEATQTVTLDVGALGSDSTSVTLGSSGSTNVTLGVSTGAGDAGEYTATVSSEDDTATANVTVLEPGAFIVDIVSTNNPVEGENLTVTAAIENTGDVEDAQTITLDAGALGSDSTSVTLAGGNSTELTLAVGTGAGDAGEYTATVSSEDDTAATNVTVLSPAAFTVDILSAGDPVEGENLTVTAAIENTGDVEATQTITLDAGVLGSDSTSVTLGGGNSTEVTLAVGTGEGDAGSYTATVTSEDDTATANVTVLEPALFAVNITAVDETVLEGETVTVEYAVENTGDVAATQDITFAVAGVIEDTEANVTLAGGETFAGSFAYETGSGDAPGVNMTVASADDTATASVTVNEPAAFAVEITDVPASVTAGESVTVEYAVENTGDVEATQNIEFDVAGEIADIEPGVTLAGGEAFTGTFAYETGSGDVPGVDVTVASANDTTTASVTVLEPAAFAVEISDIDSPVTAGETVTVEYAVENTGDIEATQDITFAVDGAVEGTEQNLTLAGGETFAGQFTYDTTAEDTPGIALEVASVDDQDTANVTVLTPAAFAVEITDIDDPVTAGETITVEYAVENTGDVAATQDITFTAEGSTEDTEANVTLTGGETFAGSFAYETGSGDAPGVDVTVASADDAATASATVEDPAAFAVEITDIDEAVAAGTEITVGYAVENTGGAEATQDITFTVDGDIEETKTNVTLDGGETVSDTFVYVTAQSDVPEVSVAVASEDDTATQTVTVDEEALFAVTLTGFDETVTAGETVVVEYAVENTGDIEATQDITFTVAGSVESTEASVTLAGGETFAGAFAYETGTDDVPGVNVTVASADDSAGRTVAVNAAASFDVTLAGVDDPVTAGETVTVEYAVENTGDVEATQDIVFEADGALVDTEPGVTLAGDETVTGQFTYQTGPNSVPGVNLTVSSADDAATAPVTVDEPPFFAVTLTGVDDPVTAGETLTVECAVENTGDVAATQDITFAVAGAVEAAETNVTLQVGETFAGQFSYETGSGDTPGVDVTVASADNVATASVTVLEPAAFAVELTGVDDPVTAGDPVTVDYTVENTGDIAATQNVTFAVAGTVEDTQTVTLAGGETVTGTFAYQTGIGDVPGVDVTVSSADDAATTSVTVDEPAFFAVEITDIDAEVAAGTEVAVAYEVENTGTATATQSIEFTVDGTVEDTASSVTLDGGETRNDTFVYATGESDTPEITVAVASANTTATETVTVNKEALFAVEITDIDEVVTEGEPVTVEYAVENTGDTAETQDIGFTVEGALVDTEANVTLAGGETFTGEFGYETETGDAPTVDLAVGSADDTATRTVSVNEPAAFAVAITDIDDVVEGAAVTVGYSVENTGGATATQDITFAVDGTVEETQANVTLAGGETVAGQFTYGTDSGDAGAYTVTVASADDTAMANVTVLVPAESSLSNLDIAGEGTEAVLAAGVEKNVTVAVMNVGEAGGEFDLTLAFAGENEVVEETATVAVGAGETVSAAFESVTGDLDAGAYNVTVSTAADSLTGSLTVSPDITGNGQPALDTTGDGLLNDAIGDGVFDIFDVQALFDGLDDEAVQANADLFNFAGFNEDRVSIFDIQGLFSQLQAEQD